MERIGILKKNDWNMFCRQRRDVTRAIYARKEWVTMFGRSDRTYSLSSNTFARSATLSDKGCVFRRSRTRSSFVALPSVHSTFVRNLSNASATGSVDTWTLYQYRICPYCNKVKALFDFLGIEYEAIEVNPLGKPEMRKLGHHFKTVPVMVHRGKGGKETRIGDSSEIYSYVLERSLDTNAISVISSDVDKNWSRLVDEKLAVLLFPNISRTFGESFRAFRYVHDVPSFSVATQYKSRFVGAFAMWAFARRKVMRKHNIEDEREALRNALEIFGSELSRSPYLSGIDKPGVADVAAFGCLRAIEDVPSFGDIIAINKDVAVWYGRMQGVVGESSCLSYR